jgi:hypothetical protein
LIFLSAIIALKAAKKSRKELGLEMLGCRPPDQMLYFSTISFLKQREARDIKRLK